MTDRATGPHLLRTTLFLLILLLSLVPIMPVVAQTQADDVQTTWRLLDYVAVDYAGAVSHREVSSPTEYAEQGEFAATVATKIAGLPSNPEKPALVTGAEHLRQAIADKADPAEVADIAHRLAASLLAAYPVPLAPNTTPDLARGATLFSQHCAACHGATGDGHGPAAAALPTPPIAFTDIDRARQRSVFALYQVITQGLDGTPMQGFASLPTDDRWALAFFTSHFAFPQVAEGERLWKSDPSLHGLIPDLKTLTSTTPATLEGRIGLARADALMAYLRQHPEAVMTQASPGSPLSLVRSRLAESLTAYRSGHRQQAGTLALSAYLDGFEPVEPVLGSRDATLLAHIEGAMGEYRAAIQRGEDAEVLAQRVQVLNSLFDDAEAALSPGAASGLSTFLGAATILLREGLEALLIVVAMIAFLRKAERLEVLPYVHAGWVGALMAGMLTWVVATWVIGISGASRELTEGFGSVFAAIVLLSVGIWMHGKAQAGQWQRYIREKMARALTGRSAWLLGGLAFVVVYREVFETILFYAALWAQGNSGAMLVGAASACVALAIIAWAMLRYSRTLPIGKFFNYSSWLMAILTIVLAGKGISALQEAGIVNITPLSLVPRVSLIGLFPTVQTVLMQGCMIAALGLGFWWNRRKAAVHP
ncbi:iron permease [Frateuria sp. Soil773]|uniref:cytochrome c/FTR1 family iron permease n=1 Tax=Frateuria sp. Soil773 TaxID=1736407 RepID=UPI0006F9183E|nr:cytochrome c/FTR1 family iron permease [Frateuria sp. Soil773]KRE89482.1 iron permease [Frateuria sp. Soil773]